MTASTLLFLPGAGGSAGFWQPVADLLPEEWPKVMLSWPGLGNEPHDPDIQGIDDLVNIVSACIAMSPTRVDLIAQSMGGLVAIRAALRHTYRIRRLVLTGTSGGIDTAVFNAADWRDAYRREYPHAAPWITEARADHTPDLPPPHHPAPSCCGAPTTTSALPPSANTSPPTFPTPGLS